MSQVIVYYNPYLPELKISIDGKKLSPYSALMSYQHQRLEKWCECLFTELYREVNAEYDLLCVSNDFCCSWLEKLAQRDTHCQCFTSQPLPLSANVYERLEKLELLGCDSMDGDLMIPVVNASGNSAMIQAAFELIEEQGVFSYDGYDCLSWEDCPLTGITLRACEPDDDLVYDAPAAIALCSSEDDDIPVDSGIPVYGLVMGTRTGYLRKRGGKLLFTVDPDDLADIILNILEEEALCPLLSDASYHFPGYALEMLTDSEKEVLTLICQASPVCQVTLPTVCDVGRTETLTPRLLPTDCGASLRIVSDDPFVMSAEDSSLIPHSVGTTEVCVLIGNDPYPAAVETITVRQRQLIQQITLFPSALCLPVGGSHTLEVTLSPAQAENRDEIRWHSSDPAVADVDPVTGLITGHVCGRCRITAQTREASREIWLEVQPEMEDILCPSGYMDLAPGDQKPWQYQIIPTNAYGADTLRIQSSDRMVAEYRGGYIIGKSVGECKIYLKNQSGSIQRELRVSVRKGKRGW